MKNQTELTTSRMKKKVCLLSTLSLMYMPCALIFPPLFPEIWIYFLRSYSCTLTSNIPYSYKVTWRGNQGGNTHTISHSQATIRPQCWHPRHFPPDTNNSHEELHTGMARQTVRDEVKMSVLWMRLEEQREGHDTFKQTFKFVSMEGKALRIVFIWSFGE